MAVYQELYSTLKHNELFLFNYGAELSYLGQYTESIRMLEEAAPKLNDQDVNLFLGMSYWGAGQLQKAEKHLTKAIHIIPYKFEPRYRLMSFYQQTKQKEKALIAAKSYC